MQIAQIPKKLKMYRVMNRILMLMNENMEGWEMKVYAQLKIQKKVTYACFVNLSFIFQLSRLLAK